MPKLIFGLNVFNEEHLLPDCLKSIRTYHPEAKIVAVDGAYQSLINEVKKIQAHYIEYGQEKVADQLTKFTFPDSSDRTLEILEEFKVDQIIKADGLPWIHEYVKRSKYLVGEEGDYYCVIDADERLSGKIPWETFTEQAYNLMLHRDDGVGPYPILRIFKHAPGIRYYGAHHAIWIGEKLYTKKDCQTATGFYLEHKQNYRNSHDPIRQLAKGAYYRHLTSNEEGAFRAQYGL